MKGTWEFFVLSSQLLSQNKKLKKKKGNQFGVLVTVSQQHYNFQES